MQGSVPPFINHDNQYQITWQLNIVSEHLVPEASSFTLQIDTCTISRSVFHPYIAIDLGEELFVRTVHLYIP